MAKRKTKGGPSLDDLVKLASELKLPEGAFDGDLRDAADDEANLIYDNVKEEALYEQLEFLHMHGFQLGRLEELIREHAVTGGNPLDD